MSTIIEVPAPPQQWITMHGVATSASMAAGAITFAVANASGKTVTAAISNTVRIGGAVISYAGRLVAGDVVGTTIQAGANTAAYVIDQAGSTTAFVGSLAAATLAAVAVGSTVLVGNTLYGVYKQGQQGVGGGGTLAHVESIELLEDTTVELDGNVVYLLEDKKPSTIES